LAAVLHVAGHVSCVMYKT